MLEVEVLLRDAFSKVPKISEVVFSSFPSFLRKLLLLVKISSVHEKGKWVNSLFFSLFFLMFYRRQLKGYFRKYGELK